MKKIFFILSFICVTTTILAQEKQLLLDADSVIRQNPRMAQMMFEPGEVLVRFADEVQININKANGVVKTSITSIDALFEAYEVNEAVQLFPSEVRKSEKKFITTFSGQKIEVPNLHNVYRLFATKDVFDHASFIEKLDSLDYVVYAEPNFIQSIVEDKPMSPEMNESEMLAWLEGGNRQKSSKDGKTIVPNDPLYGQQWYIPAVHADLVWDTVQGADSTQIIAILDTGVDWAHPDLQNKIWTNTGEIPDNGIDDDGNGKIDDIRGWDWINNDNNPTDDNSHGTHVAGIAAAEANNEIGISGVSHGAKIMPLKVFQSSGRGNTADITQGIVYAYQKGATVINMSFGSYSKSYTMEDALVNAYATTVLVAAAGNDNKYIGPELDCIKQKGIPFYPAAYSFVLGVQDASSCGLGYSNYDNDPVQSNYYDLLNYELTAPGTNILSTVPNGGYRVYLGTSMATPIVSAIAGIYKSIKSADSQELMWGNLIYTSSDYINVNEAINTNPIPKLMIVNRNIIDTLGNGDNDGKIDAGELIEFWFSARNTWGQCDSVMVMMQFDEFEDTSLASYIDNNQLIGSTSSYAINSNELNPIKMQFTENIAHNRDIRLEALLFYPNSPDTVIYKFTVKVSNGTELSGILTEDKILTPDRFWLIENSLRIGTGVTLTVLPGTNVEINANVDNRGTAFFIGNPDSLISLKGYIRGNSYYSYVDIDANSKGFESNNPITNCTIKNLYTHIFNYYPFHFPSASHCLFEDAYFHYYEFFNVENQIIHNSIIRNSYITNFARNRNPLVKNSLFDRIQMSSTANYPLYITFETGIFKNTIFNNITNISTNAGKTILFKANNESQNNSFLSSNNQIYFVQSEGSEDYQNFPNNYWGTLNENKIKSKYYDFWNDASLPYLFVEPKLNTPSDSCHAHVWKVLVNGADAQDEYVEPVGVGPQRFDVYFNREMDPAFTPQLTFGVRYPYTQQSVSDSARWDSEHKIFTAYKNMQIYTGDGINRIRVAGARDLEGWEIPVEDMRFEFLVDAAGSASTDFMATPGIGKVALEWHEPDDLPTLLGYNMYRFHHITDTTFSDTTLVNTNLVNDTLFTDFSVNPLQRYYYMYKIVRTDFTESDFSKVVNATVLTASPGDANGDLIVNVQDIISIVGHILNQNPQPFLSEAADVNEDGFINLLDIIGVVNIIMGADKQPLFSEPAYAYLNPETIRFKSDGTLSGFQFQLIGPQIDQLELRSLLPGFEYIKYLSDDTLTGVIFSLDNKLIPEGEVNLFDIKHHPGTLAWGQLFAGNSKGDYVPVYKDATSLPEDYRYNFVLYPNPSDGIVNLKMNLPERANVQINIYNVFGQIVYSDNIKDVVQGQSIQSINLNKNGAFKGIHFISISYGAKDSGKPLYRRVEKFIIK